MGVQHNCKLHTSNFPTFQMHLTLHCIKLEVDFCIEISKFNNIRQNTFMHFSFSIDMHYTFCFCHILVSSAKRKPGESNGRGMQLIFPHP